jgi:hypothetical protein
MKKVLLIGDSIRMSYQAQVKLALAAEAEVVWPEENARFAKYTLWQINGWIEELGKPDIIHWNNGIWDIYRLNEQVGIFTSMDEYIHDMARILKELRKTGAQIIWASTTAVDDRNVNCRNDDIDAYNLAVEELIKRENAPVNNLNAVEKGNIPVNDLNAVVKGNISSFIGEDYLHLSGEGEKACAEAVVDAIRKVL